MRCRRYKLKLRLVMDFGNNVNEFEIHSNTEETTGTSRFPKVTGTTYLSVEELRMNTTDSFPNPNVSTVIGLPYMSLNNGYSMTTPRPQSMDSDQNDGTWDERNSFPTLQNQLSRFLGTSRNQQQRIKDYHNQSTHGLVNYQQRHNNSQAFLPNFQRYFEQIDQFRALPIQIHQKLREETPHNIITAYFGNGITLAILHMDNIVEFGMCHVIFTRNIDTNQYWLKAFSKQTRSQEGNMIKFNRLLTGKMNLEFCGTTAFLIGPSNSKTFPLSTLEDKHMFNFFEEKEASRFAEALKKGRTQLWNHTQLKFKTKTNEGFYQSRKSSYGNEPFPTQRSLYWETLEYGNENDQDSEQGFGDYNRRECIPQMKNWKYNLRKDNRPVVHFSSDGVQLFVKMRIAYTLLGVGKISITKTPSGYDELTFRGPRNELICDHLIYSWTQPEICEQNSIWECSWSAAANLLITINPKQLPVIRELKLFVEDHDTILQFYQALQESASAALTQRQEAEKKSRSESRQETESSIGKNSMESGSEMNQV